MSAIEEKIATVYDAALRYVRACHANDNAAGRDPDIVFWRDRAWHDLAIAVTGECRICDPGTCPYGLEAL